uniref:Secreted protein n=1 Tax=Globodera pallida TaxID=36090 RepID=A0A183CFV1_GLOPA
MWALTALFLLLWCGGVRCLLKRFRALTAPFLLLWCGGVRCLLNRFRAVTSPFVLQCIRLWHRFVQQFAQCLHNVVNPHQMLHCATKTC